MKRKISLVVGCVLAVVVTAYHWKAEVIPVTWDMVAIKKFHLPPPDTSVKVTYAPEEYYRSLPDHVIVKTYPYYIREFEKPGYLDSLRTLEPEVVFDERTLKTEEDWIKAGKLVFEWPVAYTPINDKVSRISSNVFKDGKGKMTPDGIYPFSRYVVNEKGKVLVGSLSCASCHTRVMESGEVVPGAQGNVFNNVGFSTAIATGKIPFNFLKAGQHQLNFSPWAPGSMPVSPATAEEFAAYISAAPNGVIDRQGCGYLYPIAVPTLIGIQDIKYLDRSGLMKHDNPGDMMRYAAFNQGMDMLTSYNGFIPGGKQNSTAPPLPSEWNHPFGYVGKKYTDAQLYALTKYIYSLEPPENPHHFPKALIEKGRTVFAKSGCVTCHTPPLYTNNKLTPANGFEPPADHFEKYNILNISVETDSVSTLHTRRGTGYYKVPSLRGVWFQSAFFHNGNLTTLEEVLDSARLSPDFIPTGYKPPHVKTMAVKGHPFGMELSKTDKTALIAFLKTL